MFDDLDRGVGWPAHCLLTVSTMSTCICKMLVYKCLYFEKRKKTNKTVYRF